MSGKGDKPRPFSDREQYDRNFDAIFRKPKDKHEPVAPDTGEQPDAADARL